MFESALKSAVEAAVKAEEGMSNQSGVASDLFLQIYVDGVRYFAYIWFMESTDLLIPGIVNKIQARRVLARLVGYTDKAASNVVTSEAPMGCSIPPDAAPVAQSSIGEVCLAARSVSAHEVRHQILDFRAGEPEQVRPPTFPAPPIAPFNGRSPVSRSLEADSLTDSPGEGIPSDSAGTAGDDSDFLPGENYGTSGEIFSDVCGNSRRRRLNRQGRKRRAEDALRNVSDHKQVRLGDRSRGGSNGRAVVRPLGANIETAVRDPAVSCGEFAGAFNDGLTGPSGLNDR